MTHPTSLLEALLLYKGFLYRSHTDKKAQEIFNQTQTALTRYTIQGWGGPSPQGRKPTKAEIGAAQQFMQTVRLIQIQEADQIQSSVFEKLQSNPGQRYTYGSKLKQFLDWVKKQDWCPYRPLSPLNRTPKYQHGHGAVSAQRVTSRTGLEIYSLKPDETPALLNNQLEDFYQFLTQPRYSGRLTRPVKPKAAKGYIVFIRRVLGWFHRFARPVYGDDKRVIAYSKSAEIRLIPLDQLKLDLLIPKVKLKYALSRETAEREAKQAAEYVDQWLCAFLDFLEVERKSQSRWSLISTLIAILALVRFQYYLETEDARYSNIPAMQIVKNHLNLLQPQLRTHKPVSNESMKWLDLPEVWQKLVVPLQKECAYRRVDGHLRTIAAIAQSFQLFVLWGCLTFRPPRRQQEFRELKLSNTCSIHRPANLPASQLIHPLPEDRTVDKYHGYLHKAEDGVWYMDMTPESYKTGKTYGHQSLKIPNERLADGKSFYDYLEAYLYGYYRDGKGNWRSGGELVETPPEEGCWYSLRMALNPTDHHVFVSPTKGSAFPPGNFCNLFRISANRLTGQRLPPHLLRDIFATWFLDQGYTPERIASLAYAMGHSEETLRKIYDRRRPADKNRPIEEAMTGLIQQYMS